LEGNIVDQDQLRRPLGPWFFPVSVEPIEENGQAYFPFIPATFRNQEVAITVESNDFELSDPDKKYRLNQNSLYLLVLKKPVPISGRDR
jgi:hypothetical protein